jgi:hypothetical protein
MSLSHDFIDIIKPSSGTGLVFLVFASLAVLSVVSALLSSVGRFLEWWTGGLPSRFLGCVRMERRMRAHSYTGRVLAPLLPSAIHAFRHTFSKRKQGHR